MAASAAHIAKKAHEHVYALWIKAGVVAVDTCRCVMQHSNKADTCCEYCLAAPYHTVHAPVASAALPQNSTHWMTKHY